MADGFNQDEKWKAIAPSDDFKHESVDVEATVNTFAFTLIPNVVWLQASVDCWIRFDGTNPTAALPAMKIVADTLHGPFPIGRAAENGIKVIRDSGDGVLAVYYGTVNKENNVTPTE